MSTSVDRVLVDPVVVGVDGSEPSPRAADWATDEAVLRGVPLRVVYASLWERYEGTSLARDVGEQSERVLAEDMVDVSVVGVVGVVDRLTYRVDDARLHTQEQALHGVADDWLRRR